MTLEPLHIQQIIQLAYNIDAYGQYLEEDDDFPPEILQYFNDLKHNGKHVLKSIDGIHRYAARLDDYAMMKDPFDITYSCDGGSTTSQVFQKGIIVNFCHAVLTSTPSDLEKHMKRTIVGTTYTHSRKISIKGSNDWIWTNDKSCRCCITKIPTGLLNLRADRMVHDIALYLSESEHMLWMQNEISKNNSFFIIDGPIYPKQLMYWIAVNSDDIQIHLDSNAIKILQNYINIVDFFIENNIPMVGFVKNPRDTQIVSTMRNVDKSIDVPWDKDSTMFGHFLSLEKHVEKPQRYITYTNWFLQPNQFYEKMLSTSSPLVYDKLEHKYPPEDYKMAFFMVHVPYIGTTFKIEAPYGLVKNENVRNTITKKVLYDMSISGEFIPKTLKKADDLARITPPERDKIVEQFKNFKPLYDYNVIRWGVLNDY